MSARERDRLKVIEQVDKDVIGTEEAAQRLRLTRRQVQRLAAGYRRIGDRALVHGLRGRRSNNALALDIRDKIVELARTRYAGHGPTLMAELLAEEHGIAISRERLRRLLLAEGLWIRARRGRRHRCRRPRRPCFGELVQMDTSEHDWLEGRGPTLVLITMIDDATGRKLSMFAEADTTEANMELIARWVALHGRPLAIYTDWASHFRQAQVRRRRPVQTQIERALSELRIGLITANSPQAKGRVERTHGTDQDRLVKGLRRQGARTPAQAQRYLEQEHLPKMNEKFAVEAANPGDAHRSAEGYDLEAILSVQEPRRVQNDWTVSIDGVAFQIEPAEQTERLRGQNVMVERRRDGSLRLRWADRYLKFHRVRAGEAPKKAVDMPAYGQIRGGASRPRICPQALDNSQTSYPHAHSHDDEVHSENKEMETMKKPVRIPNRTRKPPPDHPWR